MSLDSSAARQIPVLDLDPFADDFLADPYAHYESLRQAGPVIRLGRYGLWAMGRYEQVFTALRDHDTYCSSAGVGLSDFRKEKPWRPPSLLLEADPPEHTRARGVVARALSPRTVRELRAGFERAAVELADALVARQTFDAVADLAEAYPLRVFPDAVGLRDRTNRGNLLRYGNMAFNAFGPRNHLFAEAMTEAEPVREWIAAQCRRESLQPDGLGTKIYAGADAGEITEEEAALLVRSLLSAGVDTTVVSLGAALHAFATHPGQWALLRDDPTLARAAFEEVLRYASPVQTFFRTTTTDVEVAGVSIPTGEKVLLFLGAANRDPRQWGEDADAFDIRRRSAGHVAFGLGIHGCVGQAVARLEAEVLLTVLAARLHTIELAGEPKVRLNNTMHGFATLPVRVA
jgi:4-methoxybenzoate monooxygenase (O-demethylating)